MADTEAETSLREDLLSSMESAGAADGAAPEAPVPAPPPAETEAREAAEAESPAGEGRSRDEKGRFAPKAAAPPSQVVQPPGQAAAPEKAKATSVAAVPAPNEAAQPPPAPAGPELKPPAGWKPAAREYWAKLPREVQEEAVRRDREAAALAQESRPHRELAQAFQQVVAPYEAMIRAEGGNPLTAVRDLLQTAAALRTAPPGHRAKLVANLIRTYGVPIDALDAELAGQAPPPGQAQQLDPAQLERQISDRILKQLQAQQAQRAQSSGVAQVTKWAEGKEFFQDVRLRMAAIIQAAREEGSPEPSLDEAYDEACETHPRTKEIWKQRKAAEAAAKANATTQRTVNASSSVKSSPAAMNGAQPDSVRGDLLAAMQSLSGR